MSLCRNLTGRILIRKSVGFLIAAWGFHDCGFIICIAFVTVLCGMMMTCCDVSAIAKPWKIQHRIAKLVAEEFFEQGDLEKLQLNQRPIV